VTNRSPHEIVAVNSGGGSTEVLARVDLLYQWIQQQIQAHGGSGNTAPDGGGSGSSASSGGSHGGGSSGVDAGAGSSGGGDGGDPGNQDTGGWGSASTGGCATIASSGGNGARALVGGLALVAGAVRRRRRSDLLRGRAAAIHQARRTP